jgi:hypothetical protein
MLASRPSSVRKANLGSPNTAAESQLIIRVCEAKAELSGMLRLPYSDPLTTIRGLIRKNWYNSE